MTKVTVFDTTLRDGEQAPDNNMTPDEKLKVALGLKRLGVDVIETGFPAASSVDFEACALIAKNVSGVELCGLARCNLGDILAVHDSLVGASNKSIHVFIPTSDIHLEKKIGKSRDEALKLLEDGIAYAKTFFNKIYVGCEDATRSDVDFLIEVCHICESLGVDTVILADTVGTAEPEHIKSMIRKITSACPNVKLGIHAHDDLGLATINTLTAIESGVGQIQTTIGGIGERTGNCALEQVVANVLYRKEKFGNVFPGLHPEIFIELSRLIFGILGRKVPHESPIIGENAFRHASGIHIDGLKKDSNTYEPIPPETFGGTRELMPTRHSGKFAK